MTTALLVVVFTFLSIGDCFAEITSPHPTFVQRYTTLRNNPARNDQEQKEYCDILSLLAERAMLRADKNLSVYAEELLSESSSVRQSAPQFYIQALRLQAHVALYNERFELALQKLYQALQLLESNNRLVQFALPTIPARSYEASSLALLHDSLSRRYTDIPTALALEYGLVCHSLAIALEERRHHTVNTSYHITKTQRILYRLSALTWSAQPDYLHAIILTRSVAALFNMLQLQQTAEGSTPLPQISFLKEFLALSVRTAEQTLAACTRTNLSTVQQEALFLAQSHLARIQCSITILTADSLVSAHNSNAAHERLQEILRKARQEHFPSVEADVTIRLLGMYLQTRKFDDLFRIANEFLSENALGDYRALHPAIAADIHNFLARSYAAQGKTDIALIEANTAFEMSLSAGVLPSIIASARVISLLKELSGNFSGALEFRKIADRYNDSLLARTYNETTLDEQLQFSSHQQHDETIVLQNLYNEQEHQLVQQRWFIWIAIIVTTLSVVGITLLTWLYTSRNRALRLAYSNAEYIETMNAQLLHTNNQLQDMHKERTEFFGIVVHDLKTPLNSITLLARSLEDLSDIMSPADKLDTLHALRITTDHMRSSISKLLDVNNLESNVLSLKLTAVSLLPIISTVLERLAPSAEKKLITIQTQLPKTLHALHGDAQALQEVLENLLSNAIKFSPHNETVILRVETHTSTSPPPVQTVSQEKSVLKLASSFTQNSTFAQTHRSRSAQMIRIEVEDHGKGIPAQEQPQLFQKFSRLSTRPTGDEHSSGLGLFIVRKYVEAMHGTVTCESIPGVKTIFAIDIPVHIAISSSSARQTSASSYTGS